MAGRRDILSNMKFHLCLVGALFLSASQLAPFAFAQSKEGPMDEAVIEGKEVDALLAERESKILKLSLEEQLQLRAAQIKAADDPDVKAAVEKRNQAIQEFRQAFRNSLLKIDPKVEPILNKIAVGQNPGF